MCMMLETYDLGIYCDSGKSRLMRMNEPYIIKVVHHFPPLADEGRITFSLYYTPIHSA